MELSPGRRPPADGSTAFVAFLRAVNVGKNRRLPMAEVTACLEEAGFSAVETHLATGNVRFCAPHRSRRRVEEEIERVLAARAGFEVPTIAYPTAELTAVYAAVAALDVTAEHRYVTFLKEPPDEAAVRVVDGWDAPGEGARVVGRAVHWWIDHPSQAATFSNARAERLLGTATTRDLKVVRRLVEKWADDHRAGATGVGRVS